MRLSQVISSTFFPSHWLTALGVVILKQPSSDLRSKDARLARPGRKTYGAPGTDSTWDTAVSHTRANPAWCGRSSI